MEKYKRTYTKAEIADLRQWFWDHRESFPQSFRMNESTNIPDMAFTVKSLVELLDSVDGSNPIYSGQVYFFMQLKEALQAAGYGA